MENGGYVRKVYEDTQKLVRDLLVQGERLAALVAALEQEKRQLQDEVAAMREELESCRGEERVLRGELLTIEEENLRLAGRYGSIERQNSNITNLYVASYRLHGTLDRQEVLATIQEIVANLMGCEEMALLELDPAAQRLSLVTASGLDPEPLRQIPVTRGLIGRAAQSGVKIVVDPADPTARDAGEEGLTACVPLVLDGAVVGVLALFRLLPQKRSGYEEIDYELMDLLATHAATALYCTALHARRQREAPCA